MKTVFMSDRGKIRPHNEDNGGVFFNKDGDVLAVVADGMGGHRAGDVASNMATISLQHLWESSSEISTPEIAEKWLRQTIISINEQLFKHSQDHMECQGMGTTFVGAICTSQFTTVGHIGDSRCYLKNASGFKLITEDHSLVNELVRSGQISREDAEHHPRKNVLLRALGTETSVEMDVKTIILENGDVLLLCSDGLSNKVPEQEMEAILSSGHDLQEQSERLVTLANQNGGEDNITLAAVCFTSESESG